jgi:hypothetical protein
MRVLKRDYRCDTRPELTRKGSLVSNRPTSSGLDCRGAMRLVSVAQLPWPHFGRTRTLNAAIYCAPVCSILAGQRDRGQPFAIAGCVRVPRTAAFSSRTSGAAGRLDVVPASSVCWRPCCGFVRESRPRLFVKCDRIPRSGDVAVREFRPHLVSYQEPTARLSPTRVPARRYGKTTQGGQ